MAGLKCLNCGQIQDPDELFDEIGLIRFNDGRIGNADALAICLYCSAEIFLDTETKKIVVVKDKDLSKYWTSKERPNCWSDA